MTGATTSVRPAGIGSGTPEPMPCITVRPPWSWCIAEAGTLTALGVAPKLVENRGRPAAAKWVGTDWAIHAGKRWDADGAADVRVQRAWRAVHGGAPLTPRRPWVDSEVRPGAVVAVARLSGCHRAVPWRHHPPAATCCQPWGERYHGDGDAWHLVWDGVRKLRRPVPVRGQLAVPWLLPADVAAQVAGQLGETGQREELA